MNTTPTEQTVTLTLTPEALSLLSTVLDFHDDDAELAENADESLDTVAALRDAVADAVARQAIRVGSVVVFREGSGPHAANVGIRYVVTPSPSGEPFSIDRTHGDERPYVWLVDERDVALTRSRQRTRSANVADLEVQN